MESWKDIETLADIPRFHAHHTPQRTALIFGERRTTFSELDRSACEAAAGLWAEGARPGARIAWLDLNSDRTYEMLFGCAKARMVFCPVNWRLALPEIRQTIEDAGAELLFVGKRFFDLAERLDLPNVRKIFTIDADRAGWTPYLEWRARFSGRQAAYEACTTRRSCCPDLHKRNNRTAKRGDPVGGALRTGKKPTAKWRGTTGNRKTSVCSAMPCFHIAGLR
jgi:acyl-CoA synthetase (AMP-forming)/AMP-acid ligase II